MKDQPEGVVFVGETWVCSPRVTHQLRIAL
jgi:hypothetical protein